jgi:hypothetical protein
MKTVRFQEPQSLCTVVCEVTPRSEWSQEDRDHTWFALHDYDEAFRSHDKLISEGLQESHRAKLLEGSPQSLVPGTDGGVDIVQVRLTQWSRQAAFARGLERRADLAQVFERKEEQRHSIQAVLEVQEQLEIRHIVLNLRVESLRAVSERCTANARAFATKMGIASQ